MENHLWKCVHISKHPHTLPVATCVAISITDPAASIAELKVAFINKKNSRLGIHHTGNASAIKESKLFQVSPNARFERQDHG